MKRVEGTGPKNASIMIIGEAPGADEEVVGKPFVGASGEELNRMLAECHINRAHCYITNVIKTRPKNNDIEEFITDKKTIAKAKGWSEFQGRYVSRDAYNDILVTRAEIDEVKPNIVIACGDIAMWALTGKEGITNWRGSILEGIHNAGTIYKIIPIYHPAAILRMWEWRTITLNDLRRARLESLTNIVAYPKYRFVVRPSFDEVMMHLYLLRERLDTLERDAFLSVDIETRLGHIACIGLATSTEDAICIPFMCIENEQGYWTLEQEQHIVQALRYILTHERCFVVGQNFLYDAQYFAKHWGFIPNCKFDTMLAQHTCFPALPKSLAFLSSIYCRYHQYWKDDGKLWEPKKMPEERLWQYNCRDAVITFECFYELEKVIKVMQLEAVWQFQMSLFMPVLEMMLRGVRINHSKREEFAISLVEEEAKRQKYLNTAIGKNINIRSTKQLQQLFYQDFGVQEIRNRKTKKPTTDDDALKRIGQRELLLKPIVERIAEMRSIGVYYSTFVQGRYDTDRRLRCSYNIGGTTTFRFSSSEDAFGFGMNLQNVPPEDRDRKEKEKRGDFILPNIRQLFIPDVDYAIMDWDLDRADLQVVVEEADDEELRHMLRAGVDLHIENAKVLFNRTAGIDKDSPERQLAKTFVHGTNYGGSAKTMAMHCSTAILSLTVHEAEVMQQRWFGAHPGIERWHHRVEQSIYKGRFVENRFGYRRHFFERPNAILPEALAWIPQSTVACTINRALVNIHKNLPTVQLLLQVHDSLVMQARIDELKNTDLLSRIKEQMKVVIPYPQPLIIPSNCKLSERSWGDVKKPTKDNELSTYLRLAI